MLLVRRLLRLVREDGSETGVLLETVVAEVVVAASITTLISNEPVYTPTTFTLEVSLICKIAIRLLMKLVRVLLLAKKELISMAK
jgi:hypothetical protein